MLLPDPLMLWAADGKIETQTWITEKLKLSYLMPILENSQIEQLEGYNEFKNMLIDKMLAAQKRQGAINLSDAETAVTVQRMKDQIIEKIDILAQSTEG